MSRLVPALVLAVLLLPVLGAAAAHSPGAPVDEWKSVKAAMKAGDFDGARARYDAALHATIAARDAGLDASILAAFANASAGGNGSLAHALASQVVDKGILHGAYLEMEHQLYEREDGRAAEPWFLVLREKFGDRLDGASVLFNEMKAAPAEVVEHRDEARAMVLAQFAGKVPAELDAALLAWDEGATERQVLAVEALVYYGPLRADVARVLGAALEADLRHELSEFVEAAAGGDRAEAEHAADEAKDLLALYASPAGGAGEHAEKFLSAVRLVVGEYDAYVRDGKVLDAHGYEDEIKGLFLPALKERWIPFKAEILAAHPHEAEEIEEALEAMEAKVLALAPNAEVRALGDRIALEAAEATGVAVAPASSFAEAAGEFRAKLAEIVALHEKGDRDGALAEIQEAYLSVYGPRLEPLVLAAGGSYNADIERLLNLELKSAVSRGASPEDVRAIVASIEAEVEAAEVAAASAKSAGAMFFNSLLIIVREGFEAILVVGALATYLLRTGHKDKAPLVYAGAVVGVVASFLLYFLVRAVYDTLPINREILEGATALLAVVVLFYVSYWLISKVEVGKWNRFIQGKMKGALAKGNGFALAGVAFLAVFREGFETVLFYQGLYAGSSGHGFAVTMGVVVGSVLLAAAFIGFYRFGVKLPMRPFFIATSVLLYYLAFAFMGAGIHELQEAGVVSTTVVAGLASLLVAAPFLGGVAELMGVYPTVETLVAQSLLIVAILAGLAYTLVYEPRRAGNDDGVVAEA